jgi:hypothetical protein
MPTGARRYDHLLRVLGPSPGAQKAATADAVRGAQQRLADHGLDPGTRSGQLDHATRIALQRFQSSQGLAPTGTLDSPTRNALAGGTLGTAARRAGREGLSRGASLPALNHSGAVATAASAISSPSGGVSPRPPTATTKGTMRMRGKNQTYTPTGFRVPVILNATIAALGTAQISIIPQMDFRGENLVIDPTIIGPNCTVTVPTIGTIPQIAGGVATTGIPGTMFSPSQAGALDFTMDIANQGNSINTTVVSTLTSTTLNFAALLFGREVEMSSGGATTGVAHAGSYRGY